MKGGESAARFSPGLFRRIDPSVSRRPLLSVGGSKPPTDRARGSAWALLTNRSSAPMKYNFPENLEA